MASTVCTRSRPRSTRSSCSQAHSSCRRREEHALYVIIVGAGKVGLNLARELLEKVHEVTLTESDRPPYEPAAAELEHAGQTADRTELAGLLPGALQRA